MAFENIDVNSLKQSINSCIQSINYNTTSNLINNISNNNVWDAESRNQLKSALERLKDVRYKELVDYLKHCLNVVSFIEQYKEEENKITSYQNEISSLSSQMAAAQQVSNQTYVVIKGDTVWGISHRHGITMDALVGANGMSSIHDTIYPGQTLIIPGAGNINVAQYQGEINNLKNKISQCRTTMESLESKVSNMI